MNMVYVAIGTFFPLFCVSLYAQTQGDEIGRRGRGEGVKPGRHSSTAGWPTPTTVKSYLVYCWPWPLIFPHFFSTYQTSIMTTALMYVVLGLGLNIVVGLAGLLDLGYVAFYAVGAYTYALLHYNFGIGFWVALPLGGLLAALFGILLGIPVLRLRGDYLAIVTLGFGEIIRLVMENWGTFPRAPAVSPISPGPVSSASKCRWARPCLYLLPDGDFCDYHHLLRQPAAGLPAGQGLDRPCVKTRSPVRPWASTK